MTTPPLWKTLDKFAQSWNHRWTSPIQWDPKKRILVYNLFSKKLHPWAIRLYLLSFPFTLVILIFAIAPIFGPNKLPFRNYMVILICLTLMIAMLVGETAFLIYAEDYAHAVNCLVHFIKALTKGKSLLFC